MTRNALISRALCAVVLAGAFALAGCGGGSGSDVGAIPSIATNPPLPPDPPASTPGAVTCLDHDNKPMAVAPKTVTINNDSDGAIYPILAIGKNEEDQWVQGCLRTQDPHSSNYIYRLYVNEGQGIPPNSSVTITLPLFSELPAGTLPNAKYITWWNGGRVVLADRNDRLRLDSDQRLATPASVTCTGEGAQCALSVYAGTEGLPEDIYAQLSEFTLGDSLDPPAGQTTRWLKPDNVGYNISYVDHVYLPVAIGPKNNPYIGYSGSTKSLPSFRSALNAFLQAGGVGEGWPVYNLYARKLPGGYNIFAQRTGTLTDHDVPVKPVNPPDLPPVLTVMKCIEGGCDNNEKKAGNFGAAVQNIQNLWGSCVAWTADEQASGYVTEQIPCPDELKVKMEAVKAFFKKSHDQYLALHASNRCPQAMPQRLATFTYWEALLHIYGWVPFNEGCGSGANKLADTVIPGWTHATIQPMYIHDLQYNHLRQYVKNDTRLTFNPYVKLIHDDLGMSAYGFSVDDAVGFMSELGDGLVFTVGGDRGLENKGQFTYSGGFSLALGVAQSQAPLVTQPLLKKYGVCAFGREAGDPNCEQDKQDVTMPSHSQIAGFRVGTVPSYPIKVRFTDAKDNRYTLVIKAPFPECPAAQCDPDKALVIDPAACSVVNSNGVPHPKSSAWCQAAYPHQTREDQVTKNSLQATVAVDYLP